MGPKIEVNYFLSFNPPHPPSHLTRTLFSPISPSIQDPPETLLLLQQQAPLLHSWSQWATIALATWIAIDASLRTHLQPDLALCRIGHIYSAIHRTTVTPTSTTSLLRPYHCHHICVRCDPDPALRSTCSTTPPMGPLPPLLCLLGLRRLYSVYLASAAIANAASPSPAYPTEFPPASSPE